jgi:hypothetical protein
MLVGLVKSQLDHRQNSAENERQNDCDQSAERSHRVIGTRRDHEGGEQEPSQEHDEDNPHLASSWPFRIDCQHTLGGITDILMLCRRSSAAATVVTTT